MARLIELALRAMQLFVLQLELDLLGLELAFRTDG
jgi:hypothetical protein